MLDCGLIKGHAYAITDVRKVREEEGGRREGGREEGRREGGREGGRRKEGGRREEGRRKGKRAGGREEGRREGGREGGRERGKLRQEGERECGRVKGKEEGLISKNVLVLFPLPLAPPSFHSPPPDQPLFWPAVHAGQECQSCDDAAAQEPVGQEGVERSLE